MYYSIMSASSGGITIEYLERQPFAKVVWLSRLAEVFLLRKHMDTVYAINAGYAGDQKKLQKIQQRLDFLMLVDDTADVEKLAELKKTMAQKRATARKVDKRRKERKKAIRKSIEGDRDSGN